MRAALSLAADALAAFVIVAGGAVLTAFASLL